LELIEVKGGTKDRESEETPERERPVLSAKIRERLREERSVRV
jgi:hypothetical protein